MGHAFDRNSVLHGDARFRRADHRRGAAAAAAAAPADSAASRRCRTTLRRHHAAVGAGLQGAAAGQGHGQARGDRPGHRALHRLDHRREDVRQLAHARRAGVLPARPRHQGLGRGRAADDRRRAAALLDPRDAGLQGPGRPAGRHAGLRRRAARDGPVADGAAAGCRGAARRRQAHHLRHRLQGAQARHRAPPIRAAAAG